MHYPDIPTSAPESGLARRPSLLLRLIPPQFLFPSFFRLRSERLVEGNAQDDRSCFDHSHGAYIIDDITRRRELTRDNAN